MERFRNPACWSALCLAALLAAGCRNARQIRDAEYLDVVQQTARAAELATPAAASLPPVLQDLSGPQPVEMLVDYALLQNPEIHAARKRVDALGNRVPQAASLADPTVEAMGFPFYPAVPQTAAGRTTAKLAAAQQVPWPGKLGTRAQAAEAETDMARADLAAKELEVVDRVKRAYYELYFLQQAIRITEEDRRLMEEMAEIAQVRYRTGVVGQEDVLRAQVEVSNLANELIQLRQQETSTRARLAQVLHVSPDTPIQTVKQLPAEQVPHDLERLYEQAVTARPELHAQLAAIRRDRHAVELARLAYLPDFRFSVDWAEMSTAGALAPSADGIDDVGLGMMFNVPIYRKRLDAGVREAEAQTVASARQYDALRDRTVEEVKDLYAQAVAQYEMARLLRDDIIPKAEQTLEVSRSAYQVGNIDFLQLIDSWRQLLRFQIAYQRTDSQLRQTLAMLERVLGGEVPAAAAPAPPEDVPMPPPLPPEKPSPTPPGPKGAGEGGRPN